MQKIIKTLGTFFVFLTVMGLTACTNIPIEDGKESAKAYVVQLVATSDLSKATSIKNTFVKEGYKNTKVNTVERNDKKIHRVQIGPFGAEADGKKLLMEMKARYRKNQYVNKAVVKTIYGK